MQTGSANSVDHDETAPDLGLLCLPRPVCLKVYDHYATLHSEPSIEKVPFYFP